MIKSLEGSKLHLYNAWISNHSFTVMYNIFLTSYIYLYSFMNSCRPSPLLTLVTWPSRRVCFGGVMFRSACWPLHTAAMPWMKNGGSFNYTVVDSPRHVFRVSRLINVDGLGVSCGLLTAIVVPSLPAGGQFSTFSYAMWCCDGQILALVKYIYSLAWASAGRWHALHSGRWIVGILVWPHLNERVTGYQNVGPEPLCEQLQGAGIDVVHSKVQSPIAYYTLWMSSACRAHTHDMFCVFLRSLLGGCGCFSLCLSAVDHPRPECFDVLPAVVTSELPQRKTLPVFVILPSCI